MNQRAPDNRVDLKWDRARVRNEVSMLRVLIIEDDTDHAELIGAAMRAGARPVELVHARTIDAACRLAERERFGCVILDHSLPDGFGTDFLKRCEQYLMTTPVVGLSTSRDPQVAIGDLRGGCIEFYQKHDVFREESLRGKIDAAIEKFAKKRGAILAEHQLSPVMATPLAPEPAQETRAAPAEKAVAPAAPAQEPDHAPATQSLGENLIDPLTGLANSHTFAEAHKQWHTTAEESCCWYTMLLIDIDKFDAFVRLYGTSKSETVLQDFASALVDLLHEGEFIARVGTSSFGVLTTHVSATGITAIADRVRTTLNNAHIPHAMNTGCGHVTVSLGAAAYCRKGSESAFAVLTRAKIALANAQDNGRNRASISLGKDTRTLSAAA